MQLGFVMFPLTLFYILDIISIFSRRKMESRFGFKSKMVILNGLKTSRVGLDWVNLYFFI